MTLKSLPLEERPRERLLRDGAEVLSLAELIAIILGSGTSGKSVLALSQEILERFGGLEHLLNGSVSELMQIKGIGKAKAIQLKAVFAIARKCRQMGVSTREPIDSAQKAFLIAEEEIAHSDSGDPLCPAARCARALDPHGAGLRRHPIRSALSPARGLFSRRAPLCTQRHHRSQSPEWRSHSVQGGSSSDADVESCQFRHGNPSDRSSHCLSQYLCLVKRARLFTRPGLLTGIMGGFWVVLNM